MKTTQLTQIHNLTPEQLAQKLAEAVQQIITHQTFNNKHEPENEEKLLTRKEAAKYLKISLATLNNWSNKGVIQKHKIGNLVRYKEHELKSALHISKS